MKKLLLIFVVLMLTGCVAYPAYDEGYNYPYYGSYPYGYWGPDVNIFVSNFHGGHRFHGRHGFHGGGHGFHGGGHWGGGRH